MMIDLFFFPFSSPFFSPVFSSALCPGTSTMVGMSWSAAVAPVTDTLETSKNDGAEPTQDPLALPDSLENLADFDDFGYDAASELLGSRTETSKTYIGDDGDLHAVVSPVPVHYLDNGVWEEIDLNI